MLSYKLVHLIQYHSDRLTAGLLSQVERTKRAESYANVSPTELKERVSDIYSHLGAWLVDKSETDIEERYIAIGARRAAQNVPLSELVWVIVLTKNTLREYINDVSSPGRAADVSEKDELLQRLDIFFDHAIHAAVVGYERAVTAKIVTAKVKARRVMRKAS